MINIALPKGRLGEKVYDILSKAGYDCEEYSEDSRKLVFTNKEKGVSYFWVKPSDVGVYVERGVADIGIVGKDIFSEYCPDVYEFLDLNIGICDMCVCGKKGFKDSGSKRLRVATKFPHIARQYFSSKGRDIDIIKLHGSIELAPILGLSDVIVDIVETGTTLKENGLVVLKKIMPISARVICNKINYQFKYEDIGTVLDELKKVGK